MKKLFIIFIASLLLFSCKPYNKNIVEVCYMNGQKDTIEIIGYGVVYYNGCLSANKMSVGPDIICYVRSYKIISQTPIK